ncbi:MAG: histidine phosphatase family protein, partial [Planctomycetaceae bacterium]|nr:histidine phosphatase family protein [Planctomycetaceae bacterium]
MTTFYLIRHALTDLVDKALAARAPGVSLNATGRRQAERLAERLAREPIRRIFTGPLERARETAAPLALRLGLEPIVSDALDEVAFGDWTGM